MLTERRPTKFDIKNRVDRRFGPTFCYPFLLTPVATRIPIVHCAKCYHGNIDRGSCRRINTTNMTVSFRLIPIGYSTFSAVQMKRMKIANNAVRATTHYSVIAFLRFPIIARG